MSLKYKEYCNKCSKRMEHNGQIVIKLGDLPRYQYECPKCGATRNVPHSLEHRRG